MDDKLKLEKVESKGYGVIYKLPMLDTELDVVAKAFYAYICSYAGAGDTAFPGMDKICHDLGVSRQRLERHRKALIEKGYITIKQVKDKGRFSHNEYTINKKLSPVLQNATTEKPTTEIPTTENVTYNNNIFNNNNINNNSNNKTVPDKSETEKILNDLFEKWYNLYDHKKGRPKAFSSFKTCLQTKKYDIGTLVDKTYEYINGEGLDKKYRKHPSTFLNQYHPDDDYTKQNGNVNKPKNNFMEALNERTGSSNFINNDSKLLPF